MNAAEYTRKNSASQVESYKASTVFHMMDHFAWYKVAEYRQLQFAPVREQIIQHLKLIPNDTILGMPVYGFMKDIESRSDDEIIRFVFNLQQVILPKSLSTKELFGNALPFFQDLNLKAYEYNQSVHPAVNGNEG